MSFHSVLLKIIPKDLNLCRVPGTPLKSHGGDKAELEGLLEKWPQGRTKAGLFLHSLVCFGFAVLPLRALDFDFAL